MSSRLNPREYDVVELRDALGMTRERPDGSGSDREDSNRIRCQSDSGNQDDDVWLSLSEFDRDESFGDGSSPSECRATVTDTDASVSPADESRFDDPGVEPTGERSNHIDDGGTGVHTSARRSKSTTDRPRNMYTDRRQELEQKRSRISTGSGDSGLIPLAQLPNSVAGQMEVLDWLEKLLSVGSHEEALNALEYYRSIGWLSAESHEQLRNVLEGLEDAGPADPEPLRVGDHRESLRHIAALARFR